LHGVVQCSHLGQSCRAVLQRSRAGQLCNAVRQVSLAGQSGRAGLQRRQVESSQAEQSGRVTRQSSRTGQSSRAARRGSQIESLLASKAQTPGSNACFIATPSLHLTPPFMGSCSASGSGTVPNPTLKTPLGSGFLLLGFRVCPWFWAGIPSQGGFVFPFLAS